MGLEAKKLGGSIFFLLIMMLLILATSTVVRIEAAAAEPIMSTNSSSSNSNNGEEDEEEFLLVSMAEMHPELEFLADSEISRRMLAQPLKYDTLKGTARRSAACRKDPTGRYNSCTTNKGSTPKDKCSTYKRLNHCN